MWKTLKWSLLSLAAAAIVSLAGVAGYAINDDGSGAASGSNNGGEYGILNEIEDILEEDFVLPDNVDPETLQKGAIDGALASLNDSHTVYITAEQLASSEDLITGTFEGIGAGVDQDPTTREIIITTPFKDSPAEKAGILPGDVILTVDGESTEGWTTADAVHAIRGPSGTPVTIGVRHLDGSHEDITIIRDLVTTPTVFREDILDENGEPVTDLAYVYIQKFTEETPGSLRTALQDVKAQGYKGLILDLRNNPGGGLDSTVSVADMFLDGGVVLTSVDRNGGRTDYRSGDGMETDLPMVVLVNARSASGSEVIAGALQDRGRAKLIGEQTFGKGSVNHLRELSNGGALYVTIARWLTPNGTLIEGVGLTPDIKLDPTLEEIQGLPGPQLWTAIELLHSEINGTPFSPPVTPSASPAVSPVPTTAAP
jgi:carboxyl-terminal processing protease